MFIWNAWCKREPGDFDTAAGLPLSVPFTAILPCLSFFLSGIQYWHTQATACQDSAVASSAVDAVVERNMELCAASLRRTFASDLFFERLVDLAAKAPGAWDSFTEALSALYGRTASVPKLKPLWEELRTLSDPLHLLMSSEPALTRDVLGADMHSDDVTRRTLMLAMWAMMDRSVHSGVSTDSLALLMHDVCALQGSKTGHFLYNMWLSGLFILHSNKAEAPERVVARHFLLAHLPRLFLAMRRFEPRERAVSRSPLVGVLSTDDSLAAKGALEQAFYRVRQWPQFLYINTLAPSTGAAAASTAGGAGAAALPPAPAQAPPDVWTLVGDAFVEAGAMEEAQVIQHIKVRSCVVARMCSCSCLHTCLLCAGLLRAYRGCV